MELFRSSPPLLRGPRRRRDDRGSQFLEFAGIFPLLLIIVVIAMELFASFLAMERLNNAARTGARVAADQGVQAGTDAARESLPPWLDQAEITSGSQDGSRYVQATAAPPFMFPAADLGFVITRRVDMPTL